MTLIRQVCEPVTSIDESKVSLNVHCTGSNIRDLSRATDFDEIDNSIVELFNDGTESSGNRVYRSEWFD